MSKNITRGLENIADIYKMARTDADREACDREARVFVKCYNLGDTIENGYIGYYNYIKKTK